MFITVSAKAADAAQQAAAAAAAQPVPLAPPQPPITAQDVANYVDPQQVAQYLPAQPPQSDFALMSHEFFRLLENATVMALFAVGLFLLARLLHAAMIHRSVRRAIEAKSTETSALIEKLNKPYEPIGALVSERGPASGDDRNGLVLLAIGLAMAGFGMIQGVEETIRIALGAALFPTFVGVALLVRRRLSLRDRAEERAAERG